MPYFEKITRSGRLLEVERYFATRDGRRLARGENRAESRAECKELIREFFEMIISDMEVTK